MTRARCSGTVQRKNRDGSRSLNVSQGQRERRPRPAGTVRIRESVPGRLREAAGFACIRIFGTVRMLRTCPAASTLRGVAGCYECGANLSRRRNSDGSVSRKPSRRNPRGLRLFRPCFRGFAARVAAGLAAVLADQRVPGPTLLRRRGQVPGLLSVLRGERNRERSTGPAKRSPAAGPFSGARLSEENEGFTRDAVNATGDEPCALRPRPLGGSAGLPLATASPRPSTRAGRYTCASNRSPARSVLAFLPHRTSIQCSRATPKDSYPCIAPRTVCPMSDRRTPVPPDPGTAAA